MVLVADLATSARGDVAGSVVATTGDTTGRAGKLPLTLPLYVLLPALAPMRLLG